MKMWKKQNKPGARWLSVILATALLAGTLSGCGADSGGEESRKGDAGNGSAKGSSALDGEASGSSGQDGKGRYVEIQESLPEELNDWSILQMYAVDDNLRFLACKAQDGKVILREWEKQGESFEDVTQSWLSSMEFACAGDWLEVHLAQGKDGRQYLYAGYMAQGEENFQGHLWKVQGEEAVEITPEKWTVPNEEYGSYEMVQGIAVLDNGTLISVSYTSLDILSQEDGSIIESQKPTSFYEGGVVSDG